MLLRACCGKAKVDVIAFRKMESDIEGCEVVFSDDIVTESVLASRRNELKSILRPWDLQSFFVLDKRKEKIIDDFVSKKHYDYIVVRYLSEAYNTGLMKYACRLVVDIDDHPHDQIMNMCDGLHSRMKKMYLRTIASFSKLAVKRMCNKLHTAFFTNPLQLHGRHGVFLPNVPFEEVQSEYVDFSATTPQVLFIGTLDYKPNYMGVDRFLDNVWPKVLEQVPEAKLHIVGVYGDQNTVRPFFEKWSGVESVSVLGYLKNLDEEYNQCRLSVSPMYSGAGTSIKLLEALQRKRVCVTTRFGFRGAESFFEAGNDVPVADNDDAFAELVVKALTDSSFNRQVAENAYEKVGKTFSHGKFFEIVEAALS